MPTAAASDRLIETLRGTIIAMVQHAGADLTARQLGVFLICYPNNEPQTVRGLAQQLNISRPAITRALDRLADEGLLRRKIDPDDRRSVLTVRTAAGQDLFRELKRILANAAEEAARTPPQSE